MIIRISIIIIGIHKLFSGEANKDFSPLTSQWEDFVLDTLQHKAVLKVLPRQYDCLQDHDHYHFHNDNDTSDNEDDDQITERGTEAAAVTTGVQWLELSSLSTSSQS